MAETQRRRQLAACRAILAQIERDHTDSEKRAAAAALGRSAWLPDPQQVLPLAEPAKL